MILNTIRLVADALDSVVYGANVQLQSLTLDGGDPRPADSTIADETRNAQVAQDKTPLTLPALTVSLDGSVNLDGEAMQDIRYAEITVLIRHVMQTDDTAAGNAASYYTIKAAVKALRHWLQNAQASDRVRNSIQVIECIRLEQSGAWTDEANDTTVTGGIKATLRVCDLAP